jgi:hypothetical protein
MVFNFAMFYHYALEILSILFLKNFFIFDILLDLLHLSKKKTHLPYV